MRALRILLSLVLVVALAFTVLLLFTFQTVHRRNTLQTKFDTLIVLGTPARKDGSVSPAMRERVNEGVREYRAGVAPYIIMSGSAAHNTFVEAQVMARLAESEGVPASAILTEDRSHDTIQNIWYSYGIMQQHGWHSAAVISEPFHLPRTALILSHYKNDKAFLWATHAAPWPVEDGPYKRFNGYFHEALGLVKLRIGGFTSSKFLPAS